MMNMDRHKCKLCSRRFSSGRALGGHMRSHLATLPLPPKMPQMQKEVNYTDFVAVGANINGGGGDGGGGGGGTTETCTESTSSECFEEEQVAKEDETESEVEKGLVYGLRENPKKSFRLVDPEFLDDPSVVVQDRESETESTRKPTRRRSKRTRRMLAAKAVDHVVVDDDEDEDDVVVEKVQDMIINKPSSTGSLVVELEPVSSVSDTSPEEDLALCLIMLSRDVWSSSSTFSDNSQVLKLSQTHHNIKFKFRCEICNRVFASSQALGSHRTSHVNKKIKMNFSPPESNYNEGEGESKQQFIKSNNNGVIKNADKKVHECPFCGKVFGSGQALGGHKRSHLMSSSTTTTPSSSSKPGDSLVDSNSAKIQEALMIDLNLPAPMEEEEEEEEQDGGFFCLQEVSALSDSVFINPIKH